MRTHQNTLLAMKLSTVLLSLIAVVLIVMLLTGSALAKRTTEAQKPQAVIQAPAQPSAKASHTPVTSKVVMIYVVTATPSATAPVSQTIQATRPAVRAAAAANSDLPAMPELAAIPDVPNLPAPAPRSNGGGGGGGGGGSSQNSPAPAPAAQPQPQPQPPVTTKTS